MINTWTFDEISSSYMLLLKFIAVIPFESKTYDYIGTHLLAGFCLTVNFIYNSMITGYGLQLIRKKNFELGYLCEQVVVQSISFRYLLVFLKRRKILELVKKCKTIWLFTTPVESKTIRIYERKAYYFQYLSLAFGVLITTFYIVSSQFIKQPLNIINGTAIKPLPFRFYVEIQEESTYVIISIFQSCIVYIESIILTAIDTMSFHLIMMACGYLKIVQDRLKSWNMVGKKKKIINLNISDNIRICVKFHQKIMSFCEDLEKYMRTIYFITVFPSVYNLSIVGIKILENNKDTFKFILMFSMNLFHFFIYQYIPENLLIESGNIANSAYSAYMKSMNIPIETNKMLCFMILRGQKPIQLTAAGIFKLSLENFGIMVKSAFSFFALLRKVQS